MASNYILLHWLKIWFDNIEAAIVTYQYDFLGFGTCFTVMFLGFCVSVIRYYFILNLKHFPLLSELANFFRFAHSTIAGPPVSNSLSCEYLTGHHNLRRLKWLPKNCILWTFLSVHFLLDIRAKSRVQMIFTSSSFSSCLFVSSPKCQSVSERKQVSYAADTTKENIRPNLNHSVCFWVIKK